MVREIIKITTKETTLNVTQSAIDSVRMKNITKSGCRIYKDGYIGIAGTLGDLTDEIVLQAEKNLLRAIPYPYEPSSNLERIRDLRKSKETEEEFVKESEDFLTIVREEFPQFIFSNKIRSTEIQILIENTVGLKLCNMDRTFDFELLVKHIDSVNVFDAVFVLRDRVFNGNKLLNELRAILNNYHVEVELPKVEKIPVLVSLQDIGDKLLESLNGEMIGREASIFSDKIGSKVFHDDFTLYAYRGEDAMLTPFFDMEGVTIENDKVSLIEDGVILRGYTDKKTASDYNTIKTASSGGSYDEVPSLSGISVSIKPSKLSLDELLNGRAAILVMVMSGGDCTNEGNFASPVQLSFLYQDGKVIGKLPEFGLSGNIYEMFGKDFTGYSIDKAFFGDRVLVTNMKIN